MRLEHLDQIATGTKLAQPLYGQRGRLLLGKDVVLNQKYLALLHNLGVPAVYVHDVDTADIAFPDPVSAEVRAAALSKLSDAFDQVARAGEQIRQIPPEMLRSHLAEADFVKALVADGAGDALCGMSGVVNDLVGDLQNQDVLTGLNSIRTHDQYTFMHSLDVTVMGLILAKAAGWDGVKLRRFGIGCLLHDLGKILVSPHLLNKTGKLSEEEFVQLKAHPAIGYEVIRAIAPRLGSLVPAIAHQHHERQDGSGYPRGIKGNERLDLNQPGRIHDFAALCAVADIYDAMASHRPYRGAHPIDEVVATITRYSGTHLNPEAVRLFLAHVTPFPVCSAVRIKTGAHAGYEGVVTDVTKHDLRRPKVRLFYNPSHDRTDPVEIDLAVDRDIEFEAVREGKPLTDSLGSPNLNPPPKARSFAVPKAVLAALRCPA